MKTRLLSLAGIMLAFASNSFAQSTAYGTTTAVLVTPLSITKTTDMHFGTIAASATAGTVVLDFDNGRTATGGASLPAGSTTQTTAVFAVVGEGTSGFAITLPTDPITLTGSLAGTMTVGSFLCDAGATTALESGAKTLKVKATLTVPANTVAGTYEHAALDGTGLFVTVNYN